MMVVGALTPTWPKGLYAVRERHDRRCRRCAGDGAVGRHHRQRSDRRSSAARSRSTRSRCSSRSRSASAVLLVSLLTDEFLRDTPNDGPEIYALYLVAAIGGIVMASANDLIVLFLGLETLSLALYVLAASNRRSVRQRRVRHQVLRARRVRIGVLPLRHCAALRRDRHDQHHRDGRRVRATASTSTTRMRWPSPASRC